MTIANLEKSLIRNHGARLSHSMDPCISVQNKNFIRTTEKLAKVPGTREETKSHLILTIPWNSAKLVKISPGIIARLLHADQKQMGLQKEQCGHLRYCCNQVWTKNGGRIPWNVTAICETFKISCLIGRHQMKGSSECCLTDQ